MEVAESQVHGWAASFSVAPWVGLGMGLTFVNPLYYHYEAGSEVLFELSNTTCTVPISLVDKIWAGSWGADAQQSALLSWVQ